MRAALSLPLVRALLAELREELSVSANVEIANCARSFAPEPLCLYRTGRGPYM